MKREENAVKRVLDGGEAVLEALRNLGVEYVMSSPGSEWGSLWEAFARQKVYGTPGPIYLNSAHETLAVNLAGGYTLYTGRMQAVTLHAGVGLMQGSLGVHAARLAELAMVILSGESQSFGAQKGFDPGGQWYSSLNYVGGMARVLEPLVKWSGQATHAATVYELVTRAGEIAQSTPAGPTYLDVPIELQLALWDPPAKFRRVPPIAKAQPRASELEKLAGMLVKAKHPVISTGGAGRDPEGYAALKELAELLAIPVVEHSRAAEVSNFPKSHSLHQGFDFGSFIDDRTDLVLVVRNKTPWYPPYVYPRNAEIIVIDEQVFRTHMAYQSLHASLVVEANVSATLRALVEAVRAAKPDAAVVKERLARWTAEHAKLEAALRNSQEKARSSKTINPIALCATLAEVLPKDAIYLDETITHNTCIQSHVGYDGLRSYFRVPSGLGQGLGYGLGVKLAARERMVVLLIGDGSFMYNPVVQSLSFGKEHGLPMLVVVFNNNGYRGMRNNQLSYYPDGAGAEHKLFYGEYLNGPDYEKLPGAFDGVGIRVEKTAQLRPALEQARKAVENGRTVVMNVLLTD